MKQPEKRYHKQETEEYLLWASEWDMMENGYCTATLVGRSRKDSTLYISGTVQARPAAGTLILEIKVPPPLMPAALRIAEDLLIDLREIAAAKWKADPKIPSRHRKWPHRARKKKS